MNKSRDSYKCGNGHGSLGGTEAVYKAGRKSGRRNRWALLFLGNLSYDVSYSQTVMVRKWANWGRHPGVSQEGESWEAVTRKQTESQKTGQSQIGGVLYQQERAGWKQIIDRFLSFNKDSETRTPLGNRHSQQHYQSDMSSPCPAGPSVSGHRRAKGEDGKPERNRTYLSHDSTVLATNWSGDFPRREERLRWNYHFQEVP